MSEVSAVGYLEALGRDKFCLETRCVSGRVPGCLGRVPPSVPECFLLEGEWETPLGVRASWVPAVGLDT